MPPVSRPGFSELMSPDLFRVFVDTGEEAPIEFSSILNVIDMPYNPITDQQISGLGPLSGKDEGEPFEQDQPIVGGTREYEAGPFGLAIEFTWEAWRDELYGVFQEMVRELRRSSDNRLEVDAHSPLNNATSGASVGFDGVSLLNAAHPQLGGGADIANQPASPIQFSFTAVQAAMQHFHNLVDERGLPRLLAPSMALVTPEFYHDAREILGSTGKPLVANNEINSLVADDLGWMVSHYLTSTTLWFIMARQGVHDLNFFVRDQPMFDMFDDPRTKNAVATVYQRHISGFGPWRGVFGSAGA
jgi:hypothetical protein